MTIPIPSSPVVEPKSGVVTTPWFLFFNGSSAPFTPGISFGGTSAGVTYATRMGQATLGFGRVYFDIVLSLSTKGTGVGQAVITGLPQVVKSVSNYKPSFSVGYLSNLSPSAASFVMARGSQSETNIYLNQFQAGVSAPLSNTDFNSSSEISISGSYQF